MSDLRVIRSYLTLGKLFWASVFFNRKLLKAESWKREFLSVLLTCPVCVSTIIALVDKVSDAEMYPVHLDI